MNNNNSINNNNSNTLHPTSSLKAILSSTSNSKK